ncbi:hypothetical protein I302_106586 [Kwoniella bestiolae CBS 10118]|uniref:Uncharacterized protein n=1 Tax=Kwoniella bestiolae CBS 10118 TaxID=1296100 RepID=A0A1B9G102_9TREE|nr:hypothetical protein I302_06152 [Kwoniella bestiolae CBS 10118]OCF24691.1 hypothetical protein I302_06152 [Kwoniella bestiolae CBS 10118]
MSSQATLRLQAADLLPRLISAAGMTQDDQTALRDAISGMSEMTDGVSGLNASSKQYIACSAASVLSKYGLESSALNRRAEKGYNDGEVDDKARKVVRGAESFATTFGENISKIDFEKNQELKNDVIDLIDGICKVEFGDDDEPSQYNHRASESSLSDYGSPYYSGTASRYSSAPSSWNTCGRQSRGEGGYSGHSDSYYSQNSVYSAPSIVAAA